VLLGEFKPRPPHDTRDYATWVADSAGYRFELEDPQHLEELDTVVPDAHHGAGGL
jgi:hypothetical protein